MNNILDIIYEYSIKNRLLDKNAINKILEILIKHNNLDITFNVNNNPFLLREKYTYGCLDRRKHIIIYMQSIKYGIKLNDYMSDFSLENNLTNFEKILRLNLFILLNILHEIEHAIQINICRNNDNSTLENKLIILEEQYKIDYESILKFKFDNDFIKSFLSKVKEYNMKDKLIGEYYYISLHERLADINAYDKILQLIQIIKDEIINLYELINLMSIENKLQYYHMVNGPTIEFFSQIGLNNELLSILNEYNIDNLPFEYRFKLGLPINNYEYQKTTNLLQIKRE